MKVGEESPGPDALPQRHKPTDHQTTKPFRLVKPLVFDFPNYDLLPSFVFVSGGKLGGFQLAARERFPISNLMSSG